MIILLYHKILEKQVTFLNIFPPKRNIYNRTLNPFHLYQKHYHHLMNFVIKFIRLTMIFFLYNRQGTSTVYWEMFCYIAVVMPGTIFSEHLLNCGFQLYNCPTELNVTIRIQQLIKSWMFFHLIIRITSLIISIY